LEVIRNYLRAPSKDFYAIPFRGQRTRLPVIRVDLKDLCFNVQLGRLIIDRLTVIEIDTKDADPEDPRLQEEIESKILASKETELLQRLIRRDGQLEPGVITSDGYVINGNRRLAVLRSLARETGEERFAYMDVAVLPEDAKRDELYLLEASMQMTPEPRARYGPVTTILQIRRGLRELGLQKERISEAMNMEVEDLDKHLERLALMDEYLTFIGRPAEYRLLEEGSDEEGREGRGKNQHFIEIQNIKRQHERARYWESLLRHLFLLVADGKTFDDIRTIKGWKAQGVKIYTDLISELGTPTTKDTLSPVSSSDAIVDSLSNDLEELGATLAADHEQTLGTLPRPGEVTKEWRELADVAFEQTIEVLDNRKKSDRPVDLLRQALGKLNAVDLHGAHRAGRQGGREPSVDDLSSLLDEIRDLVETLRAEVKAIKKARRE
jgi:hypothetical protein